MTITLPIEVFNLLAVAFCVLQAWSLVLTSRRWRAERLKWFYERLAAGDKDMTPEEGARMLGARRIRVTALPLPLLNTYLLTYSGGPDEDTMLKAIWPLSKGKVPRTKRRRFLW